MILPGLELADGDDPHLRLIGQHLLSDSAIISQFERQIADALGVRAWAITKSATEWKERRDQIKRHRALEQ